MPKRNNPFKPNRPVHPGMFTGRGEEIIKIENALYSTLDDNPHHLLFLGERGIGKTSLLLLIKALANGDIAIDKDFHVNYLTVYFSIDKNTTLKDFTKRIIKSIEREFRKCQSTTQKLKDIWNFTKQLEIAGTKINSKNSETLNEFIDDLIYAVIDTLELIQKDENAKKDGLLLLIDEVDNSPKELELGMVLKKLTEQLAFEGSNKFLIILAGLPNARNILSDSHPSSLRLFEELNLGPLTQEERKHVINTGLIEANEKNEQKITIDDKALEMISFFSEGYPHFLQQFGYCSYEEDDDNFITESDVQKAAKRAISLIGDKYYKELYFNKIKKESYREILKIMSNNLNNWTSKKSIRNKFSGDETTLNNAINALTSRNIILRKQGARGQYKLQWMGFALWIKLFIDNNNSAQHAV
jgi:Cdc6-like AAA superfamily ATPase